MNNHCDVKFTRADSNQLVNDSNLVKNAELVIRNDSCVSVDNVSILMEITPPVPLQLGEITIYVDGVNIDLGTVHVDLLDNGSDAMLLPIGIIRPFGDVVINVNAPMCGELQDRSYVSIWKAQILVGDKVADAISSASKITLGQVEMPLADIITL